MVLTQAPVCLDACHAVPDVAAPIVRTRTAVLPKDVASSGADVASMSQPFLVRERSAMPWQPPLVRFRTAIVLEDMPVAAEVATMPQPFLVREHSAMPWQPPLGHSRTAVVLEDMPVAITGPRDVESPNSHAGDVVSSAATVASVPQPTLVRERSALLRQPSLARSRTAVVLEDMLVATTGPREGYTSSHVRGFAQRVRAALPAFKHLGHQRELGSKAANGARQTYVPP